MRRCLLGRRPLTSCSTQLGGIKFSMRGCNAPQGKRACLPNLTSDCSSCRSADVLLGAGQLNMPRVEARPLTEAHSPDLATKSRAVQQHQKAPDPSPAEQGFKAQPLNKKILEGPVHVHHLPCGHMLGDRSLQKNLHAVFMFAVFMFKRSKPCCLPYSATPVVCSTSGSNQVLDLPVKAAQSQWCKVAVMRIFCRYLSQRGRSMW